MDRRADIPVDFIMAEKIKTEDHPDYRYWDFRDEILHVEQMRTITTGGKNGTKEKEKSEENTTREDS